MRQFQAEAFREDENAGCFDKCGAGPCPSFCGEDGFCCSGEDMRIPSELKQKGGNGNCPTGAVEVLRKFKWDFSMNEAYFDTPMHLGFQCVKEIKVGDPKYRRFEVKRHEKPIDRRRAFNWCRREST